MDCIPYINDLKVELDMLNDALHDCRNEKEYQNITNLIKNKNNLMEKYKDNLSKLSNNQICYRIYLKILSGKTPSKAIEEVSNENYINDVKPYSLSNLWLYYNKLKKIIKQE